MIIWCWFSDDVFELKKNYLIAVYKFYASSILMSSGSSLILSLVIDNSAVGHLHVACSQLCVMIGCHYHCRWLHGKTLSLKLSVMCRVGHQNFACLYWDIKPTPLSLCCVHSHYTNCHLLVTPGSIWNHACSVAVHDIVDVKCFCGSLCCVQYYIVVCFSYLLTLSRSQCVVWSIVSSYITVVKLWSFWICMKSKAAKEVDTAEKKKTVELFKNTDLSQYTIRGSEDDWKSVLATGPHGIISIKRLLTCYLLIVIKW